MSLTPDELQRIQSVIEAKTISGGRCPICGNVKWTAAAVDLVKTDRTMTSHVIHAVFTCSGCGFVRMHDPCAHMLR
jgi:hypothetical protein